jgi:hypothetical protein
VDLQIQGSTDHQTIDARNCGKYQVLLLKCRGCQRRFPIPWPVGHLPVPTGRVGMPASPRPAPSCLPRPSWLPGPPRPGTETGPGLAQSRTGRHAGQGAAPTGAPSRHRLGSPGAGAGRTGKCRQDGLGELGLQASGDWEYAGCLYRGPGAGKGQRQRANSSGVLYVA